MMLSVSYTHLEALFDYASRFDKVHLDSSSLFVTEAELAEAKAMVEGLSLIHI